uniref:Uncharacterized protein n=1 Tax=Oryzias latipes TaxID=8090 RepID=A0A3P9MMZ2_ORYLA
MANSCVQLSGFLLGFLGWLGIIIATATNDWVHTCHHGMSVCKMMDDYRAMGPWANCVLRAGNSHCQSLTQIFDLPVYIQTTRALMIIASILGLPAAGILLMSMPCINLGNDLQSSKNKRAILGGVLLLLVVQGKFSGQKASPEMSRLTSKRKAKCRERNASGDRKQLEVRACVRWHLSLHLCRKSVFSFDLLATGPGSRMINIKNPLAKTKKYTSFIYMLSPKPLKST